MHSFKNDDPASAYIGPYTSGYTVKQTIEECNKIFMLPTCKKVFPRDFGKDRPCLNHHIKKCMGVCMGKISPKEYQKTVSEALNFIKNGSKESVEYLKREMEEAAENLEFERAAVLRDRINAITRSVKTQSIQTQRDLSCDVFAVSQNMKLTSIAVVKYRLGKLIDKENFFIGDECDESLMRSEFLIQYYSNGKEIPIEDARLTYEYDESLLAVDAENMTVKTAADAEDGVCLLYTSPNPRD